MATANFRSQEDFRLMAGDFMIPLYPCDEYGDEITTDDPVDYIFDSYAVEDAQNKIDELNKSLKFYKMRLQDGYYSGIQIIVDNDEVPDDFWLENYFDFNEYGVNRYILRRMIEAEKKRINKKLLPLFKQYGFDEYCVSARFSSGETWYSKIA